MAASIMLLADASAASSVMKAFVTPVIGTLIALASLAVVFFLVNGGIQYMTSSGDPEKLEHAKRIVRNALIGLAMSRPPYTKRKYKGPLWLSKKPAPLAPRAPTNAKLTLPSKSSRSCSKASNVTLPLKLSDSSMV